MEPLLCFPDPLPVEIQKVLEEHGYSYKSASSLERAEAIEPPDGYAGAVICAYDDFEEALAISRALRRRDPPLSPLLLLIEARHLRAIGRHEELLFDDFCIADGPKEELEVRLSHLLRRTGRGKSDDVIAYGPLALNLETYQAAVSGRVLDLTFMEYELLRFLAAHPGRVFTRETLLSRVWGYEYYGGARTVDVHIRRLRAKLGEEHAHLIETVRSVGYRFGNPRWTG